MCCSQIININQQIERKGEKNLPGTQDADDAS